MPINKYKIFITNSCIIIIKFIQWILIGFCFLLLASIYVLSRFLKLIQNMIYKKSLVDDFEVCMLISFALTLWPILPTQDFFNNWINIIYFMPVGFFLHRIYDKNK